MNRPQLSGLRRGPFTRTFWHCGEMQIRISRFCKASVRNCTELRVPCMGRIGTTIPTPLGQSLLTSAKSPNHSSTPDRYPAVGQCLGNDGIDADHPLATSAYFDSCCR